MVPIEIIPATVEEVLSSGLIAQLDADLLARYPGEPVNGIDPEAFRAADGYFVVARRELASVGCGAFRPFDQWTVEIKRMFVCPECRGQGVARKILTALESEARRRGYTRSILETGQRMTEAIALYGSTGYARIERFEPYVESERSVCFGKSL